MDLMNHSFKKLWGQFWRREPVSVEARQIHVSAIYYDQDIYIYMVSQENVSAIYYDQDIYIYMVSQENELLVMIEDEGHFTVVIRVKVFTNILPFPIMARSPFFCNTIHM